MVKHYIDRAVSAKTDNRPQFQQMIKDSERGIFDVIIVWKLDRFARNRYDSARYKTQLKRNGVKLVSATEVISAGPEGIILESVLEGYAEYYSADLSEKVVRGMTENALKGIYNGGTIPFGYMIDETRHYQPDPLLAPYVEQTFQKYADGATMTDLRDWLKAHNIKNSMGGDMPYINFYLDFGAQGRPAFVPVEYMSFRDAVELVRNNGGVPVVAHPGLNLRGRERIVEKLLERGAEGLEVFNNYHDDRQIAYFAPLVRRRGALMTCGSDFHGKTKPLIHVGRFGCDARWESSLADSVARLAKGV